MKKLISLFAVLLICFSFAACDGNIATSATDGNSDYEIFDSMEYSAYVNIFYEGNGSDFENKTYTKEGIFAILQDEYSGVTRYYVWGYADQTKCCDYQWEFVPSEGTILPEDGSLVKISGSFVADENALDGYWFEDATLEVTKEKEASVYDYDLTNLSPTLVRVQLINMQVHPLVFDGKSVNVYGRVLDSDTIQHPYYDEAWELDCVGELNATTGNYVTVSGTYVCEGDSSYLNIN